MVDHIVGKTDVFSNSQIRQQDLSPVENKSVAAKNPYKKAENKELVDQFELSKEAIKAYEEYREQEKYKKLVVNAMNDGLTTNEIINLINSGEYLSNDDLAQSLLNSPKFMEDVFSEEFNL